MTPSAKQVPLRLFCAVELPGAPRAAAFAHLARLRESLTTPARVSWEREEKLHLTLKFFGDVEAGKVEALTTALAGAARSVGPLALMLEGAGVFPAPARPNVIWIGVADKGGGLARLHARVEEACAAAGFPRERRPFHPHVTLARVREANRETRHLAHRHAEMGFEPSGFGVGEIVLMRSEPGPGGSVYTPLSRHELRGGAE